MTYSFDPVPFNLNSQGNTFPFNETLITGKGSNPSWFNSSWMDQPFSTSISNPSNAGGAMPFPWMAAATVAAPIIGGIFGGQAAREQRTAGAEAIGLQSAMGQDMALAGFGAQELARDREADRQLEVAQNRLNLLESGPALSQMRRQMGYKLAGQKFSPAQITQFGDMFGGYS